jgi:2-polyprenyl-3-methyl-5-hydroxy-6-metoxy-1,4-benzoquinol methylase
MQNRYHYVEFKWKDETGTCAHTYIVPAILKIIKELNLKLDLKILDAGCGGGNLINVLYNLGFNNVWGFDASESAISLARKSFPRIADKFFKHNAYESRLPDGISQSYDLIISMEVLEHCYSPQEYLRNVYKWLNKDGSLIITTPYQGFLKNLAVALLNKFDWHFEALREGGHIKFFSKRTLSFLLHKEGFDIIRFKGAGRIPYLWKSMILVARKRG